MVLEQLEGDDTNNFSQLGKAMLPRLARHPLIQPKAFVKSIKKALADWNRRPGKRLGMAQEMGLIAELWFLKNILMKHLPPEQWLRAVKAWHGPKASSKDFWLPGCMFEVKATGPSKNSITISNIDQLDFDTADPPLYLFRISVAKRPAPSGKTLVKYIDEIRKQLKAEDLELLRNFERCLAGESAGNYEDEDGDGEESENKDWESKGYREEQKHEYTEHYQVYSAPEQRAFYRVDGNFPRLQAERLREWRVTVKKYEIQISDCGKRIDEETQIAPLIKRTSNKRYTG